MRTGKEHAFLLVIGVGLLLAAGCGQVHFASRPGQAATPASGTSAGATPKQRAAADARAMLGHFVPPPGATRLPKRPALPGDSPAMSVASTAIAQAVGYWQVTGAPQTLLAWEKAHISRSFSAQDAIVGPPSWDTVYSLPAVPGVLAKREMNVQVYDVGGGKTVIMADAMAVWEPPRPAGEVIPAGVRAVSVTAGVGPGASFKPVTLTSAAAVRKLAALVNALPVSTLPDDVPCPSGAGVTLTFYDSPAATGKPVAVATGPVGCGAVELTLNGKTQPDLEPAGSAAYRAAVLKTAGLPSDPG